MSVELLLRELDRVSEAPDAFPRLRRFVLELAVRGLLVAQDPEDGDADALLAEVTVPGFRPVRRAALSTEFPDPHEVPFLLPSSWVWCRLSQIGFVVGGGTPPSGNAENFTVGGEGIPWFTPADMAQQEGVEVEHGRRDLTEKGFASSSATLMPPGTVLFTSRAPIGYVGIAKKGVTTNQGFKSLVPSTAVDPRYVALFFRAFARSIDADAPGTTFKEVSGKLVSRLPFPLPPLAEQSRIVARADELVELCDHLEAAHKDRDVHRSALRSVSLHRLLQPEGDRFDNADVRFLLEMSPTLFTKPEHVALLRQAVIELAVRGHLGTGDPADPPAELGQGIMKRTLGSRAATRVPSPRAESNWREVELSEVLTELQTGPFGSSLHQSDYTPGGTPVINPASIVDGRLVAVPKMAVGLETLTRLASFKLKANDVVLARRGEMGRCAVVTPKESGWLCGTGSLILRFPPSVSVAFMALLIGSPTVRKYLGGSAVGATMQNLNQGILLALPIDLPPLPEQERIVSKVRELMAICDALERALASVREGRAAALESLTRGVLDDSVTL